MDSQQSDYVCPFCGHRPAQKYYLSERIFKLGVHASLPDSTSGGFDTELTPNPGKKMYYDCTGCEMKYEDISGFDISSILLDLTVRQGVISEIQTTFGQCLTTLLSNPVYRTGIVRKTRAFNSFLSLLRSNRKILVCISCNGQRRFVSLLKKKKNNKEYYEAVSLGRP